MSEDTPPKIGVIGATSFVGSRLLAKLSLSTGRVVAFSRHPPGNVLSEGIATTGSPTEAGLRWVALDRATLLPEKITHWVLLAPIWAMPAYFDMMARMGARTVVALSSTSIATKLDSSDAAEKGMIGSMMAAETDLQAWSGKHGVDCTILRPTLIYGHGKDKNLSEIARLIRKLRVFPLLGAANGKRQPVHVDDVAQACLDALHHPCLPQTVYVISGAEVLCYREMVRRIFLALSLKPLFIPIPAWLFAWTVRLMNLIPRYRTWNPAMIERMNQDMTFSHEDAARDFDFRPRAFDLRREDLP